MRTLGLWAPVVVWCALIFAFSATPDLSSGFSFAIDLPLRKAAHIVEYFILFLLMRRAVGGTWALPPDRTPALAALLSILYAMSDECHQTYVPTRVGSWADVGIDSAGVLLAFLVERFVKKV